MSVLVMAVGAVGLTGVQAHDSGAAVASTGSEPPATALESASTTTTAPPATTTTQAPATTTTTTAPAPTTTTAPPTTTTTAPPTTTTTAPPPSTPSTTVPPPRAPAVAGPSPQEQIEAIADESGWDWRGAGIRLMVGFYAGDCCHWGVYESPAHTLWIGPTAFADPARLRYVVLHELAHAWQYTSGHIYQLIDDYERWGKSTPVDALEAGGDCIATLWGAVDHHYWACPAGALQLATRRLAGDWA